MDAVSEFHTEAPQATVNEGLAHGPYVAARQGFEPATFSFILSFIHSFTLFL